MSDQVRRQNVRTEQRDKLLSLYLDGALDARARAQLEAQLAADPRLQAELDNLRQTVSLVKQLRPVAPPRNFILPQTDAIPARPAQESRARLALAAPWLTAATGAVSLLFVGIIAASLLLGGGTGRAALPAAESAVALTAEEEDARAYDAEGEREMALAVEATLTTTESMVAAEAMEEPAPPSEPEALASKEEETAAPEAPTEAYAERSVAGDSPTETPAPAATAAAAPAAQLDEEAAANLVTEAASPEPQEEPQEEMEATAWEGAPAAEEELLAQAPQEEEVGAQQSDTEIGLDAQPVVGRPRVAWWIAGVASGIVALVLGIVTLVAWRARRLQRRG